MLLYGAWIVVRDKEDNEIARIKGPDGTMLATASEEGPIELLEAASGIVQGFLAGHTARIGSLAFNPDGQFLASASDDGTLRL